MTEWVLQASGLQRFYGPSSAPVGVIDATTQICAAESVAVVGRSGSGKSTLIGMLAGLCEPQAGQVLMMLDRPTDLWADLNTGDRCRLRRGPIGLISQFTSLLPSLTTLENVLLPARLAGQSNDAALITTARYWLNAVSLSHRQDAFACHLSGGEQRRAIVARALMMTPSLLFADEPTSNLDAESQAEVSSLLLQLCKSSGTALVIVTHSDSLADCCDRRLTLQQGILREAQESVERSSNLPLPTGISQVPPVANPQRRRLLIATGLALGSLVIGVVQKSRQHQQNRSERQLHDERMQGLAFSGLSAELTHIERDNATTYCVTIVVENLQQDQSLFLLPLDVQVYVQQESRWQPFNATWNDRNRGVMELQHPEQLQLQLLELPASFTELVPGYMHMRIDVTYAIADQPDPRIPPVERRDSFFVYLQPPNPDVEKIALNNFPEKAPLFIPMPPH